MKTTPIIQLEDVWKIYKPGKVEVQALQGVNLIAEKGEFISIVGPSGSGKSTLLHMIGCLDLPTKGKVFLSGHDISLLSENTLAQIRGQKIGFIFQQFNILQNLNALENVMLPMAFLGNSVDQRLARARELLAMVHLDNRMTHKPTEMSGGEQQRVAMARALANNPEVILADEPTGNLDTRTGGHIMEILKNLHEKEHKTIIIITHDLKVADFAERKIKLQDGQIIS